MKKHLFLKSLLVAIGLLIMSINTAWGQSFGAENQRQAQMQSQMMMSSGSSYTGTVYEPFSNTTPSEQSYTPAKAPGASRKGYNPETGEWTPDAPDMEYAGDTEQSELSPIGEPWIMALFALAFAGVIAVRQYKRKKDKTMNMKNSTSKFIATLALLCTLGVGQMWAAERSYDGTEYIYWKVAPNDATWWNDNSAKHYIQLKFNDGDWKWTNWQEANNVTDGWARWLVPAGSYWDIMLKTSNGNKTTGSSALDGNTSHNIIYNYGENYTIFSWSQSYFAHGAYVYFDNSTAGWDDAYKTIIIGRSRYSYIYQLSNFSNTNIWYYNAALTFYDFTEFAFIGTSSLWGNEENKDNQNPEARKAWATNKTVGMPKLMDHSSRLYNLFITGTVSEGVTPLTHSAYSSYTSLNSTQKVYSVARVPGGTYSSANAKANITMTSYALTGATTCTQQNQTLSTSESSHEINACRTASTSFTVADAAGYNFDGWYPAANSGDQLEDDATYTYRPTEATNVYARWTAKQSVLTFVQEGDGYASGGQSTTKTATYGSAMPTTISVPTAATGYKFQGYYDGENGTGTKYYNADGSSAQNWDKDTEDGTTLYAYFEKSQLTEFTFSPTTAAGETSVTITPTITPAPTGSTYICWGFYSDSECTREVEGVTFSADPSSGGGSVTFTTPAASGVYYVKGVYRTGGSCGGADDAADVLNVHVQSYIVASDHTVTVRYMCDGVAIHAPTEVVVPAAGAAGVKALSGDDVFGYKFDSWSLGEGLDNECVDGSVCGTSKDSINISAIFNGTLTANYTKKNMIYFKNTLEWENVYVHLLGSSYWNTTNGTGNNGRTNQNLEMTLVPGTTDVFAYEYGNKTCSYVVFTDRIYNNWDIFHEPDIASNPAAPIVYPRVRDNADNTAECANFDFNAGVPMFVPLAGQTGEKKYDNKAIYYNKGYWRKYEPATGKTGYYLEIFNKPDADGRETLYRLDMTDASTSGDVFEVTIDLEGKKAYGIKVLRDNDYGYTNTTQDLASYDGSTYTTISKQSASNWKAIPLVTNTAGDYTFKLTCGNSDGNLKLAVKKPAATSDYRVLYSDDTHNTARTKRFSRTITKLANAEDIVSFFVDVDKHPAMTFESIYSIAGDGSVTWTDGADLTISSIKTSGVYNFYLKQDEDGAISLDKIEPYTGEFYIRTDAVGGTKWADYCNIAHQMSYSEYSKDNAGYTHYWMKHLNGSDNVNVKFVVANDYSAWISDTVIQQSPEVAHINASGVNSGDVSIRFSYNALTNEAKRTYLANSTANDFLVLKNNATASSNNVKVGGVDKSGVDVKFTDNQNYIYDITAQVVPSANVRVKVYAHYNTTDQNLIGDVSVGTYNDDTDSKSLLSGTVASLQSIRVLYDFKTNRLVTAWEPTGSTITEELDIDADLMIIREHQEAAQNIVLGHDDIKKTDGKIVTEKRIYGVMRFNRWILNNLSNPNDKSDAHAGSDYLTYHAPLSIGQQLPTYQRNLYYISFPFDVKVSEIFGFGTYGTHFAIQRYDGAGRAKSGYWIDSDPNWKWVPPTGTLNAFEGYVLSLSLSNMAASNTTVWANKTSEVELYFPSTTKGVTIETTDVVIPALSDEDYKCSIERDSRNVKDSYWRCIGVPCYANYSDELLDAEGHTITWQTADETLPFIYDINWQDKSLTAFAGDNFPFKAMHSYLVQYKGAIKWQQTSAEAAGIVARTKKQSPTEYTFRLELNKDEAFCDQTYVRLSEKEDITNGYDFDNDLWKQLYSSRSNIYTRIGDVNVAGNVMPLIDQTTIVPVGVQISEDGDYTFAMPDGTKGVGATLIDNITGARTNLALDDYTVSLAEGQYNERFILELSPIAQTPTGVENASDGQNGNIRKVMVDGILYIVKDGKVFDARGNRVQ